MVKRNEPMHWLNPRGGGPAKQGGGKLVEKDREREQPPDRGSKAIKGGKKCK